MKIPKKWDVLPDEFGNTIIITNIPFKSKSQIEKVVADLTGEVWLDCPNICSRLKLSKHALERFIQRSKYIKNDPKDPIKSIQKLALGLKEDIHIEARFRTLRLINNHFTKAKYYTAGGWRFVVVGDEIKTIESTKPWKN